MTLQVTKEQVLKSPPKSSSPQSSPADIATFERHLNDKKYKGRIAGAYEWFLELPVVVVLAGMWLGGRHLSAYSCWRSTFWFSYCRWQPEPSESLRRPCHFRSLQRTSEKARCRHYSA
jgi:hypothetical protein